MWKFLSETPSMILPNPGPNLVLIVQCFRQGGAHPRPLRWPETLCHLQNLTLGFLSSFLILVANFLKYNNYSFKLVIRKRHQGTMTANLLINKLVSVTYSYHQKLFIPTAWNEWCFMLLLMSYALMLTVFLSNKFMFARKILYRSRNIPFLPTVLSYTHCLMGYKKTASAYEFNY